MDEVADGAAAAPVVVGFDGSQGGTAALSFAVAEARLRRAPLVVVSAWRAPVSEYVYAAAHEHLADPPAHRRDAEQLVRSALADTSGAADLATSVELPEGDPGPALVRRSEGAALLVVGSRGRGSATTMLLGSVSSECVRLARCPVVVLGQGAAATT